MKALYTLLIILIPFIGFGQGWNKMDFSVTTYIEVTKKNIYGSEMVIYNDTLDYNNPEYLYIDKDNDNYHYTSTEWAKPYHIIKMNDDSLDTRELCVAHGDKSTECEVVDSYATQHKINAECNVIQIWISKPNVKNKKK